jgi:hypothetical protein
MSVADVAILMLSSWLRFPPTRIKSVEEVKSWGCLMPWQRACNLLSSAARKPSALPFVWASFKGADLAQPTSEKLFAWRG